MPNLRRLINGPAQSAKRPIFRSARDSSHRQASSAGLFAARLHGISVCLTNVDYLAKMWICAAFFRSRVESKRLVATCAGNAHTHRRG